MILLSILMPALGRIRLLAKDTQCRAKLRGVARAFNLFATEHQSIYPGGLSPQTQGPDAWQKSFVGREIGWGQETGTLARYLEIEATTKGGKAVYRCPLLEEGARGSGEGSNGIFDYAVPIYVHGTRRDLLPTDCNNRPSWGEWRRVPIPLIIEESPRYYMNSHYIEPLHCNVDRLGTWHGGFDGHGSSNYASIDGSVRQLGFASSTGPEEEVHGSTARYDWQVKTPSGGQSTIHVFPYGAFNGQ